MKHFSKVTQGLTLPVWVVAAAKAATKVLLGQKFGSEQIIHLPDNQESISVAVQSSSLIGDGHIALAISYSEPGQVLDITRGMQIWALVQLLDFSDNKDFNFADGWLDVVPGYGVGTHISSGKPSISEFTYTLFELNLKDLIPQKCQLKLEIVFPEGKQLAQRTSNSAFGIVDGLALIGTQAKVNESASPNQQKDVIDQITRRCLDSNFLGQLTFVIGENGFDLAQSYGLSENLIVKTGNWLGPAIVEAAQSGVNELLLFGYHGKLIKLAGGVFHTHNHLADARLEILTSLAVKEGLTLDCIKKINQASSIEDALLFVESHNIEMVEKLWMRIAREIEHKSSTYLSRYISSSMKIGSVLFDRKRNLRWAGPLGRKYLKNLGISLTI